MTTSCRYKVNSSSDNKDGDRSWTYMYLFSGAEWAIVEPSTVYLRAALSHLGYDKDRDGLWTYLFSAEWVIRGTAWQQRFVCRFHYYAAIVAWHCSSAWCGGPLICAACILAQVYIHVWLSYYDFRRLNHVHANTPCSALHCIAFTHACPTMSCILLIACNYNHSV